MEYRTDVDLNFLSKVSNQDLEQLIRVTTYDPKDNSPRLAEWLRFEDRYKHHSPDHHEYWDLIAAEIQTFGGNTLANIFRWGKGVLYKEILIDVCEKQKVNFNKKSETRLIEKRLLEKMLEKALEKISEDELKAFLRRLKVSPEFFAHGLRASAVVPLLMDTGGITTFRMATLAAGALLPSALRTTFPLLFWVEFLASRAFLPLLVLSSIWQVVEIAGPAYRVTLPACILIAVLRLKYELSPDDLKKMEKIDELNQKLADMIRAYQKSDKKMMGLYLVALKVSQTNSSGLTVEDIEADIFGRDRESLARVKRLMMENASDLPGSQASLDDFIKYAVNSCGCDRSDLKVIVDFFAESSALI